MFGRLRSSKRTEFTICFTEIRRTSSDVRKEKEIPRTVEGRECEIFITNNPGALKKTEPAHSSWFRLLDVNFLRHVAKLIVALAANSTHINNEARWRRKARYPRLSQQGMGRPSESPLKEGQVTKTFM